MKHVIIGNGPTGLVAAETLRRLQPDAEIALIGDEKEPPYSRMAIPYFLQGNIAEAGTHLRKTHDHYAKQRIHLIEGRVAKVDPKAKQIEFASGDRLPYDKLLIATGSRPIMPPVPGIDLPNVHTCWTLEDARAIAAKAKPGSRVLQLGAGFIGCIIMEALAARGVTLTVVEMGDRMVPRMMTPTAGAMIKKWVEGKGVAVHCNTAITAVAQKDGALAVKLGTGGELTADLVICAAGVRPNIEFLAGSGISMERGIRVDNAMRTSVADIYAAGDVTEAPGFHTGQARTQRHPAQCRGPGAHRRAQHGRGRLRQWRQPGDQRARHPGADLHLLRPVAGRAGRGGRVRRGTGRSGPERLPLAAVQGRRADRGHQHRLDRACRRPARVGADAGAAGPVEGTPAGRPDAVHGRLPGDRAESCMKVTFKLFATLQDYLPPEGKKTNALSLELAEETTVDQLIKRFSLPEKLVHLVLIDGTFVPPSERAGRILRDGRDACYRRPQGGGVCATAPRAGRCFV